MKSYKTYIFLLFCIIAGLGACKKDLGNYTYKDVDVPLADTAAIAKLYNVEQTGILQISPQIKYGGDPANLSYQWYAYVKSLSSPTIGPAQLISNNKDLNDKITIAPGNYYLELIITDKSNQMKSTTRTLLNVLANIETGMLVLHTANNETDVDFIASKNLLPTGIDKRLTNLFQTTLGSKMKGTGQMIGFTRRPNSLFNWITVGTNQEIKRVNGFTFNLLGTNGELFRRPLTVINPQAHINNASNELLINNGLLQVINFGAVDDALYSGVFNGDYYLAPYIVCYSFNAYGALVYDQKNGQFLYTTNSMFNLTFNHFLPPATTVPAQPFNPDNVGKEMLFMDRGFNNHAYAFFKDKTGNARYLYVLNQTKTADDGAMAVAKYDMTTLPEIDKAKFYQVGDLGNVALYATDKVVYNYDYSGTKNAVITFDGIGSNETITAMKIFKPKLNVNNITNDFLTTDNAVIYLATWDGTQGKVYELKINVASGAINPVPLKTYTGFGKIVDLMTKFRGTGT